MWDVCGNHVYREDGAPDVCENHMHRDEGALYVGHSIWGSQ